MRRYQMWLAAGVLALGPVGLTLAGPLSFGKSTPKPAAKKPVTGVVFRGQNPNTDKAQEVAKAIKRAHVGAKVQVAYQDGTALVMGPVSSPEEAKAVLQAVNGVEGVRRIENKLQVAGGAVQTADARAARQRAAMQAGFQETPPGPADDGGGQPMPMPMGAGPMGPGPMAGGMVPGPNGGGAYCPPGYGPGPMPGGMGSHYVYDQPSLPNYAWPTYAAYPNSAAVNYPQQYSASAWPYIGPFYPYPQVPLGWRKVQLEWDDGYWQLNFRPRTDRWWWFMDYRNW